MSRSDWVYSSFACSAASFGRRGHTLWERIGLAQMLRGRLRCVSLSFVRKCRWVDEHPTRKLPSSKFTMPEDSVDLWSWSTFSFVEPLFKVSNARTVNDSDVWTLSPFFTHKNIFRKYLHYVSEYVVPRRPGWSGGSLSSNRHPTYSLLRYLIVSNSLDLIIVILLETWSAVIGEPSACFLC